MSTTAAALEYIITCRLCNTNILRTIPLNIPITGPLDSRAQKVTRKLLDHLTRQHPEELSQGTALYEEFRGLCITGPFNFQDPSVMPRLELTRATIFSQLRKNVISDRLIEDTAAKFELSEDDTKKVVQAMKSLRDACCEFGQFAPKIPEQTSPIITG